MRENRETMKLIEEDGAEGRDGKNKDESYR